MFEDQVKRILTDERLKAVKTMLEKDHMIDCLFLLLIGKGRWRDAKVFMNSLKLTISDGTFRDRMAELEAKGFAKSIHIDPLKKIWEKTETGEKLAKMLIEVFEKL